MRARLEFDLPEDERAFQCALEGEAARTALADLDRHLRTAIKYGDAPEPVKAALQEARTVLHEACAGKVSIDD